LASLKKLAGQTAWYGLSSIFARMLNYLLTPYLTHYLTTAVYGEMSIIYSVIPFMNVIFTYGMETTFFRFSNKGESESKVFNTGSLSLIFTTLILASLLVIFRIPVAGVLRVENHPQFIVWVAWIIALDTLSTLPFAKLRNEGKPRKYAFIKVTGIVVNVALTIFFYTLLPHIALQHPQSFLASWYDPNLGAGYVIIANVAMSAITLLLLIPEILSLRIQWDGQLWRQMMIYSLPIMVAGFGGMINETFDLRCGTLLFSPGKRRRRRGKENLCPRNEIFCHHYMLHVPVCNAVYRLLETLYFKT
jgi:O-antigen/teichoic acid export membrane protein